MKDEVINILKRIGKKEKKKYELKDNEFELKKINIEIQNLYLELVDIIPSKNLKSLELYYKRLITAYREYYYYLNKNEEDAYLTSIEIIEDMRLKIINLT